LLPTVFFNNFTFTISQNVLMKFTHLSFPAALIFCFLFLFSCRKNEGGSSSLPDPNNGALAAPVQASVTGLVVDENNSPLPNVVIKASNSYNAITNNKGQFRFNKIMLDKYTSLITAEAIGYYKGYRIFSASSKGLNFIKIQLLTKTSVGSINGGLGGSVTTSDFTVTLSAGTVINKTTGSIYNGNITIYARYIDPLAANIQAMIPGGLTGIDSLTKRVKLQSLGMMAVELEGANGELLQVAAGKTASLKMKIPSALLSNAPATIPLWYVDEQTGLWKQEGIAAKSGSSYIGTVKHFSFWNCDVESSNLVFLEMTIHSLQGDPLPHTAVEIYTDPAISGLGTPAFGYTDSTGYVGGLVPAGQPLILKVKNECYSTAYTQSISSVTQNTDLGILTVNTNSYQVTIAGTIKNCAGQPVTNGWVDIFLDDKSYTASINGGVFHLSLLHCSNSLLLIANDINGGKSGSVMPYTIGVDNTSQLVLTACDAPLITYIVSTIAGSDSGYVDGTGPTAKFHFPEDAEVDANGNIIVSDNVNNRIRKISPTGVVTTIAGGSPGFADGTGAAAKFYSPQGLAIDAAGNIIVADIGNSRIRKISPAGVVTTIAGDGTYGFADGTGATAKFYGPTDVAIDASGNIIVVDYSNHRIRKISPAGVVTTIAGDGTLGYADGAAATAKFTYPTGVAIDKYGNIIVGDAGNYRIRKISPSGIVSTIAGNGVSDFADGIGTAAEFSNPGHLVTDTSGNIFVSDYNDFRIRKISPVGVVTTIAGISSYGSADGPGLSASFFGPEGISIDKNGNIYVADRNNSRIRKLTRQ
jgi:sugar lactone lactonase YvrE